MSKKKLAIFVQKIILQKNPSKLQENLESNFTDFFSWFISGAPAARFFLVKVFNFLNEQKSNGMTDIIRAKICKTYFIYY